MKSIIPLIALTIYDKIKMKMKKEKPKAKLKLDSKKLTAIALAAAVFLILFCATALLIQERTSYSPAAAFAEYYRGYKRRDLNAMAHVVYFGKVYSSDSFKELYGDVIFTDANMDARKAYTAKVVKQNNGCALLDVKFSGDDTHYSLYLIYGGRWYLSSPILFKSNDNLDYLLNDSNADYDPSRTYSNNFDPFNTYNVNNDRPPLKISDKNITSYVVKDGERVDQDTFRDCYALEEITFPDSYNSVSPGWFDTCFSLKKIIVSDTHPTLVSVNGVIYDKKKEFLIAYPNGANPNYIMPDTVKYILPRVFSMRFDSITNASWYQFSGISTVKISKNVRYLESQLFCYNVKIQSVTIPASVEKIGSQCFYNCPSLAEVKIEDDSKLDVISYSAFEGCRTLTSIKLPEGLRAIGDWAFQKCINLSDLKLPSTLVSVGMFAFSYGHIAEVRIPASVKFMGRGAFFNNNGITIKCAASQKPEGWNEGWAFGTKEVIWAAEP
jgi:hypothetical protein